MKPEPFRVRRENGLVFVDRATDEAFRHALLNGVPTVLRPKMLEALAAVPDAGARAHSVRYFKGELDAICEQTHPLLFELNRFLSARFQLHGLFDWLNATGYGNDYRMIEVFKAWSEMKVSNG